tara:strand:+ start:3581 stop:4303 length:723 start_codon:yes stop_codon:yes gene_type:complete
MFTDISEKIENKYNRPEEYLTNHYPKNYFDYFIDIGSRGVTNPWHLNHIAESNPKTVCYGYEPDVPYFDELIDVVEKGNITNVIMSDKAFGTGQKINIPYSTDEFLYDKVWNTIDTLTLEDIFEEHNLDSDKNWAFKIDCEGGEYSLLTDKCKSSVEILKKASHIAFEFHTTESRKRNNFFSLHNHLPHDFSVGENWMLDTFSDTHNLYTTSKEPGLRTYVLISDKISKNKNKLFWKDLI